VHSGRVRLPGLGIDRELAALRGERPQQLRPVKIVRTARRWRGCSGRLPFRTVPKRYAKLRRAERHARAGGDWGAVRKHLLALHLVELSIRRFVEREFLELLREASAGKPNRHTRTNSLEHELRAVVAGCPAMRRTFPRRHRFAVGLARGRRGRPSWIDRLMPQQRQVLVTAILGLYKAAGVDLVRQQIDNEFPCPRRGTTYCPRD